MSFWTTSMFRAPDDDGAGSGGGQQNNGEGDGGSDAAALAAAKAAAEKRAADAEKRAKDLESAENKRKDAEAAAKREAELKTIEDHRKARQDAEAREKDAIKKAEALENAVRDRIETRYQRLPKESRDRIETFRDALPIEKWEALVDLEASSTGVGIDGSPPAATRGAGRRNHARDAGTRDLHPKTEEILGMLGVSSDAAKKLLEAETEVEGGIKRGRFVYPAKKLARQLKERAIMPNLLSEENRRKLFDV